MIIKVKCTFFIDVEVGDDPAFDYRFDIEENSCPGTQQVGAALDAHIETHLEAGTCWACALQGENEIVGEPDPISAQFSAVNTEPRLLR